MNLYHTGNSVIHYSLKFCDMSFNSWNHLNYLLLLDQVNYVTNAFIHFPTTNLILYLVCYFPQYLVRFYKLKEHFAFTLISSTWLLLIRKIEEVFKGQQLWSSAVIKSVVIYHCLGLSVSLYILGWFPIHTWYFTKYIFLDNC